jgi:hypothetical protein
MPCAVFSDRPDRSIYMIRRYLLTSLMVIAFISPAAAMTEYYVAKGATTKKCSVVSKKPDGKTMMIVGSAMYKSKSDATKAMKASADCK